MAKYLVIVESPAKVKTIKKFLGANYEVVASNGHIRDLPKSTLGIDIEHDYEPKYITIRGKGGKLAELRRQVKKADKVYLATDPDREGEAISWHLATALKLDMKKTARITFNEITKPAVKASLKQPRDIDMNRVDAQQARRVLDRMVGYMISPLLWAKIKRGLSAGRVQSVALRMLCDREEEINSFIPKEYWDMNATLNVKGEKKPLTVEFYGDRNGKMEISGKEQLDGIVKELQNAEFTVKDVKKGSRSRKSPVPFITSTLQQEASKTLNFSTQKTMRLAQQLYEGVDIKGRGTIGLITYLRTDSTRISDTAETQVREFIDKTYGAENITKEVNTGKSNKKIQDAHEAIRPTDVNITPAEVKEQLSRDLFRLYQLIWKRFVASRMASAVYETTSVKVAADKYIFNASTSKLNFQGFMQVYTDSDSEKVTTDNVIAKLTKESELSLVEFNENQHFTQPPAHFTEAVLVKALEEQGIGRPSTYAPTITTIIARRYVTKEKKNLYVTELGEAVNNVMKTAFSAIVDLNFTANVESLLDMVEEGKVEWKTVIRNFYPDLDAAVKSAEKKLEKITIADEESDEICEECGRRMVIKYGPHGKFLACPGFPECRNTKPYLEKTGIPCPKCGKEIILKKTQKGRRYYGCIDNPECDFMSWQKPSTEKCPECGGYMLEKGNKLVCADATCGYVTDLKKKEEVK
ncbi:type I DNA topoisomerase [Eubacterium sp. AF17-7]|mgnify:FL=1|uniref:type I DNA topoisomerase n=1 Tax=Eubacterium sp. AF17-7 TaxID=2293105 RepID=UPI000E5355CD|nr:type I DNA topoisomerase [Eubacterium sp. AF17-7]RGG65659.1 type I DNA topoisomerase [Eubacterium sp. AF17-7]